MPPPTHGHKPFVLRLPFLVLYLSAFALCIGLIERLIARTAPKTPAPSLQKRDQVICTNAAGWSSQFQPLEASYSNLCRDFSTTFAPHTTSLSPALQTAFNQWLLRQSSITRAQWSISQSSLTCSQQLAGLEDCPDTTLTAYITAGCIRSLTTFEPCCQKHGTISLQSSSIVTSGFPALPCAITRASQLAITSGTSAVPRSSQLTLTSVSSAVPKSSQLAVTSQPTSSKIPGLATAVPKESQLAVTSQTSSSTQYNPSGNALPVPSVVNTTALISGTSFTASTSAPLPVSTFSLGAHEVIESGTFTHQSYFFALYLAPLIAIILKATHEMIVATVKLFEPFHLLSGAAHTTYPVIAQYLSSSISMDVVQSVRQQRFVPFWTVCMYLLMPFLTPIASASMSVRSRDVCTVDGVQMRCKPAWVVNLNAIRCLEILLAISCMVVLMMIISTWTYRSPLPHTSASIVSIAGLLTDDSVLASMLSISPEASERAFNNALKQYRFWIAGYTDSSTQRGQHQLMCSRLGLHDAEPARSYVLVGERSAGRPAQFKAFLMDVATLLSTVTLLALVLTYTFDYKTDAFNTFFTSQKALPKLVLVGLATLVDILFKDLERVVRITEPYRRLWLGNARPETTILLPLHGTSWSNLLRCIYSLCRFDDSHMLWQTVVGLAACLSDLNVIAVSGVLFTDAQTPEAFEICSYVAIGITIILAVVAATTVLWWRTQEVVREMPRRPDTIAAVMSYLCGPNMMREWMKSVRFASLTENEEYNIIAGSGRRFRFGRIECEDGSVRWCIDFDHHHGTSEIVSMYAREEKSGEKEAGMREDVIKDQRLE